MDLLLICLFGSYGARTCRTTRRAASRSKSAPLMFQLLPSKIKPRCARRSVHWLSTFRYIHCPLSCSFIVDIHVHSSSTSVCIGAFIINRILSLCWASKLKYVWILFQFAKKELQIPGLLIIDTPGHESFRWVQLSQLLSTSTYGPRSVRWWF